MCRPRQLSKHHRAALLVNNALHGRRIVTPTPISVTAQRVYHNKLYRYSYVLFMLALLLLPAWELPSHVTTSSEGMTAVHVIDFLALLFVAFDLVLQRLYHGPAFWRIGWIHIKMLTFIAIALNFIIHVSNPNEYIYVARLLRPLLLMERLRNVRRVALNIAFTLPKILNVIILLAVHLLFFSVLGNVLFSGISGVDLEGNRRCTIQRHANPPICSTFGSGNCTDYFATIENSAVQLFELLTGANFPVIALPTYQCFPASILFFVCFITLGVYLLLNLTLAVTYATFKNSMADEVMQKFERMLGGFERAFAELTQENTVVAAVNAPSSVRNNVQVSNPLSLAAAQVEDADISHRQTAPVTTSTNELHRSDFLQFFAILRPEVDKACAELFFKVFDPQNSGLISMKDFRRLLLNFGRLKVQASGRKGGLRNGPARSVQQLPQAVEVVPSSPQAQPQEDQEQEDEQSEDEVEVLDGSKPVEAQRVERPSMTRSSITHPRPLLREQSYTPQLRHRATTAAAASEAHSVELAPVGVGRQQPEVVVARNAMLPTNTNNAPTVSSPTSRGAALQPSCWRRLRGAVAEGFSLNGGSADGQQVTIWRMASRRFLMSSQDRTWKGMLKRVVQSMPFVIVCDVAVLINTIAVIVQLSNRVDNDTPGSPTANRAHAMAELQYATLAFFLLEMVVKALALGPLAYWRSGRADILLILAGLLGTILEAGKVVSTEVSAVISFLRFVRLLRILRIIPGFGLTVAAFGDILPVMGQYASVLVLCMWAFAVLGMECFAGALSIDNPAVVDSSYGMSDLYAINFDTLHGAMVANLYLLVLNDWPALMDGCVAGVGNVAKLYFFVYWVFHLVLVLNVLVAFVIDSFSAQKAKRETLGLVQKGELDAHFGLEDWRKLILDSGLNFNAFRISRPTHHFDVYEELYKEEVAERFNLREL